ncbi:hypothetical protein F383_21783 [Gossypium arboreum]|uniref:Uncharacterized protein n=1 Tax=Gossypium arboreum TaxID=29729 RepID=A0A0B0NZD2_GOSAR|nr:hypothetical protein F383_21783 [Gossypium arboreum]
MQFSSLSGNAELVGTLRGFNSLTLRVRHQRWSRVRGVTSLLSMQKCSS